MNKFTHVIVMLCISLIPNFIFPQDISFISKLYDIAVDDVSELEFVRILDNGKSHLLEVKIDGKSNIFVEGKKKGMINESEFLVAYHRNNIVVKSDKVLKIIDVNSFKEVSKIPLPANDLSLVVFVKETESFLLFDFLDSEASLVYNIDYSGKVINKFSNFQNGFFNRYRLIEFKNSPTLLVTNTHSSVHLFELISLVSGERHSIETPSQIDISNSFVVNNKIHYIDDSGSYTVFNLQDGSLAFRDKLSLSRMSKLYNQNNDFIYAIDHKEFLSYRYCSECDNRKKVVTEFSFPKDRNRISFYPVGDNCLIFSNGEVPSLSLYDLDGTLKGTKDFSFKHKIIDINSYSDNCIITSIGSSNISIYEIH